MSAVSQVSICNLALTFLGGKRIGALDEKNSNNAKACNAVYDLSLEEVLMEHNWTFAQKRIALATVTGEPVFTDDGVTIIYQKPIDCLKVNFTNIENALVKLEENKILSDTAGLKIIYTFLNTNPQSYTKKFVNAFATLIAHNIAYAVTSSRSMVEEYQKKYIVRLNIAMSVSSQQGTPLSPIQDDVLLSRISGVDGRIVGRTGFGTWFPCGC